MGSIPSRTADLQGAYPQSARPRLHLPRTQLGSTADHKVSGGTDVSPVPPDGDGRRDSTRRQNLSAYLRREVFGNMISDRNTWARTVGTT